MIQKTTKRLYHSQESFATEVRNLKSSQSGTSKISPNRPLESLREAEKGTFFGNYFKNTSEVNVRDRDGRNFLPDRKNGPGGYIANERKFFLRITVKPDSKWTYKGERREISGSITKKSPNPT